MIVCNMKGWTSFPSAKKKKNVMSFLKVESTPS